jgi:hypothetical protein
MSKVLFNIPSFPGFYNSDLDAEFDHVSERNAEYWAEQDTGEHGAEYANATPLDSQDYAGLIWDAMDWSAAHAHAAREWCASFDHVASASLGFKLELSFESMHSPREYNFTTDRIFAYMQEETAKRLLDATPRETLAEVIEERFTSRSGFISHYSNDVQDWFDQGADAWDFNQWATVLEAALRAVRDGEREVSEEVFDHMTDSNDFDTAFDNGMDWAKFEAAKEERRAEKREEE